MSLVFTQLAADDFRRNNENPLSDGGNWTTPTASDGTDPLGSLQIVSNQCVPTANPGNSVFCVGLFTGISWPDDQWAECVLESASDANILLRSNVVEDGLLCYNFFILGIGSAGSGEVEVVGAVTRFGQRIALQLLGLTLNIGDVIRAVALGNTLYVYQNGVLVGSGIDLIYGYTSGSAGLSLSAFGLPEAVTDFAGGSVGVGHSISGNSGVGGAKLSYSGTSSGSVIADNDGSFSIPDLVNGGYTITPSLDGYAFSPTSQNETVSGGDIHDVNFSATAFVIESWMLNLPFTEAIDLVNNRSYPMPYRVGGASVVKLIMQQTLTRYGGSIYIGTAWMLGMIARQESETPGFADIYNSAPVISGFDISA